MIYLSFLKLKVNFSQLGAQTHELLLVYWYSAQTEALQPARLCVRRCLMFILQSCRSTRARGCQSAILKKESLLRTR